MELMDKKVLIKKIGSIGTRSEALRREIGEIAINVIGHALVHGDVTLGSRLVKGVSGAIRKDALVRYLELHGPFQWDAKGKEFDHKKRPELKWNEEYVNKLKALPWDEAKKEVITSVYDQLKAVTSLFKVMQAKAAKHEKMENDYVLGYLQEAMDNIEMEAAKRKLAKAATVPEDLLDEEDSGDSDDDTVMPAAPIQQAMLVTAH